MGVACTGGTIIDMWLMLQLASVTLWAGVNVLDSILVHRYDKHPVNLMWYQSVFSVPALAVFAVTQNVHSSWMIALLLVGVIGYFGDLVFFRALDLIDVSITNIAWVILSIFLSVGGVFFLQESWTLQETIGAAAILVGILVLSLWHRHISSVKVFLLLPLLGLLYTPFYLVQKAALLSGEHILAVFFWSLIGRESCSFLIPWCVPAFRKRILTCDARHHVFFHVLNGIVIALFFGGTFSTAWAFAVGPISLVSIVGNVQPFIVLLFAWLLYHFAPSYAPRELLTAQSVQVKLVSFTVVFVGLALLAFS
jgi:drug/metabolite transporter (DMT)-like permease